MGRLTVKQLAAISQNPDPLTYDLKGDVEALVPEMVKAGITTKRLSRVLGIDLVRDPDKLANNKNLAARAAIWFWEKGNPTGESINRYADQGNFKAVCSIINRGQVKPQGPINGWDLRVHFHQRALNILPDGFTLDTGE